MDKIIIDAFQARKAYAVVKARDALVRAELEANDAGISVPCDGTRWTENELRDEVARLRKQADHDLETINNERKRADVSYAAQCKAIDEWRTVTAPGGYAAAFPHHKFPIPEGQKIPYIHDVRAKFTAINLKNAKELVEMQ